MDYIDDFDEDIEVVKETIYCCKEHVDMAIDEFLVDVEEAPEISLCDKDATDKCYFCDEKALYKITNELNSKL